MPEVNRDAAILVDPTDYKDIGKGLEKIMDKHVRSDSNTPQGVMGFSSLSVVQLLFYP